MTIPALAQKRWNYLPSPTGPVARRAFALDIQRNLLH
jgi:hypothetical protein